MVVVPGVFYGDFAELLGGHLRLLSVAAAGVCRGPAFCVSTCFMGVGREKKDEQMVSSRGWCDRAYTHVLATAVSLEILFKRLDGRRPRTFCGRLAKYTRVFKQLGVETMGPRRCNSLGHGYSTYMYINIYRKRVNGSLVPVCVCSIVSFGA